jgi:hypothetical protein
VTFLVSLVVGVLLGSAELALRRRFGVAPDLLAAALAVVVVTESSLPARDRRGRPPRVGARFLGLLLGASSCALAPVGAFLLGGAAVALLLRGVRALLFTESVVAQLLFGLVASGALLGARAVYGEFHLAPPVAWSAAEARTALLTALAVPILLRVHAGTRRAWRCVLGWVDGLRSQAGEQPSQ